MTGASPDLSTWTMRGTQMIRRFLTGALVTGGSLVAATADAREASAGSHHDRSGGLVSVMPLQRRFVAPRAWKVCTTGTRTCAAASRAARPDIQ